MTTKRLGNAMVLYTGPRRTAFPLYHTPPGLGELQVVMRPCFAIQPTPLADEPFVDSFFDHPAPENGRAARASQLLAELRGAVAALRKAETQRLRIERWFRQVTQCEAHVTMSTCAMATNEGTNGQQADPSAELREQVAILTKEKKELQKRLDDAIAERVELEKRIERGRLIVAELAQQVTNVKVEALEAFRAIGKLWRDEQKMVNGCPAGIWNLQPRKFPFGFRSLGEKPDAWDDVLKQ